MKALSIRQPWAWLIVNGYKDVENRSWSTAERGERLIHASQQIDKEAHEALCAGRHPVTGAYSQLRLVYPPALGREIELGGIVGAAEIAGCVTASDSEWFTGSYGFLLRSARPLPFQPCRGMLGFFQPEREIDARPLAEQIGQGRLL